MEYLADPGGRFASDTHRRVLAHLTTPQDDYGWSLPALFERMRPDSPNHRLQSGEELQNVLAELQKDGHAHTVQVNGLELWQMTQDGFDVLTSGMANEPPPGAAVQGPAMIHVPGQAAATKFDGSDGPAGNPQDLEAAQNPPEDVAGQPDAPVDEQPPDTQLPSGGQ